MTDEFEMLAILLVCKFICFIQQVDCLLFGSQVMQHLTMCGKRSPEVLGNVLRKLLCSILNKTRNDPSTQRIHFRVKGQLHVSSTKGSHYQAAQKIK